MRIGRLKSTLGRKPTQRRPLVRNLVTSLILYEKLKTTKARAKAIQPLFDRMLNKAKKRPSHIAIRFINQIVTDKNASRKMIEVFKDRFKNRPSGFTSVKAIGLRKGDGAEMVEISLVEDGKSKDTAAK
ncbi:50S ribosomal protein L17 [Candidatus Peribacteria bacterium]|jgi:large subunit ribosomal protein L17|nr:50S ribosomal protein L17 [Candidatus Peribacteria bacterium]MBT4021218.1 50S ribosomal protein L17 [Candidatus Peribacteria bacterium]MBT4240706.1 50S ribosomal protein L17 [Candidatus Peribacteria bacterium]MBT4473959.1 50S ribosomal protein L17 [Candidatus Peribacteria bacterium]